MYDTGADIKKPLNPVAVQQATNNNSNLQVNHNTNGVSKVSVSKAAVHQQYAEHCASAELTDLNSSEIAIDLQNYLDVDSAVLNMETFDKVWDTINKSNMSGTHKPNFIRTGPLSYMPQPVHGAANYHNSNASCSDSNSSTSESPSIKEEPLDSIEFRRAAQGQLGYPTYGVTGGTPNNSQNAAVGNSGPFAGAAANFVPLQVASHQAAAVLHQAVAQTQQNHNNRAQANLKALNHHHGANHHHHGPGPSAAQSRKQSKCVDKASDEYRRRRERNNIAVRKSREKAKVRSRETEERVKLLVKENEMLKRKLEAATEEIHTLRAMIVNSDPSNFPTNVREVLRQMDCNNLNALGHHM